MFGIFSFAIWNDSKQLSYINENGEIIVKFNNLEGTHYIVGSQSASERYGFEIFTENAILKANIYDGTTGNLITQLSMHFDLRIDRYYTISFSYSDGIYSLHYVIEPLHDEYAEEEKKIFRSSGLIDLQDIHALVLGVQFASYQRYKFDGEMDMLRTSLYDMEGHVWNGASLLDRIYTLEKEPSNSSIFDVTFDQISDILVTSTESTNIIDQDLFTITDNTLTITGVYNGLSKRVNVPSEFYTQKVTEIGNFAFSNSNTFDSYASTEPALRNWAAFVMSKLIFSIIIRKNY